MDRLTAFMFGSARGAFALRPRSQVLPFKRYVTALRIDIDLVRFDVVRFDAADLRNASAMRSWMSCAVVARQ